MAAFALPGCKQDSPPTEEPNAPTSTEEQTAQSTETLADPEEDKTVPNADFLADPDVATCAFEKTTISQLDIPKKEWPSFVRRMERAEKEDLKKAEIEIAGRSFKVLLGERPEREFFLFDVDKSFGPYWWGSWSLHSYHKIDDDFFEFTLIEDGAKIAGRPYRGEFGVIKVGKGGRDLEKAEFNGSVNQAGSVAAPIGIIEEHWTKAVPECKIPIGDYTARLMSVTYDNLSFTVSNNYHTNAQGQSQGKETVYGMQVRADRPYVLDFSNDPMVIFDQPPKDQTQFARGSEIEFAAVLIDPKLDIMIRRLNDTAVEVEQESSSGRSYKRPKSLDPKVVIARANGEVVAEGVMPFG